MINFATLLFFLRNGRRAQDGEAGRSFVAVGQGANLVKQISTLDNSIFKESQGAVNAFQTISKNGSIFDNAAAQTAGAAQNSAKKLSEGDKFISYISKGARKCINYAKALGENDKVFRGISKGVKFASENVNPLIVVSSGINVATSKDKQSTVIAEAGNLAGMFAMEGWMKKHLDGIVEQLPVSKKWKPVVRGISFVIGSIGASTIGCNVGKIAASKLKSENEKAQNELSEHDAQIVSNYRANNNFAPKNLAYSA